MEITEKRTEFSRSEDEFNYKLIIKEARTELDGKYSCVIKNDYGKIEDSCNVDVNCKHCVNTILKTYILNHPYSATGKPKIVKSLKDVDISEGETLTLEVEIYAKPEPKIVWFKNGQEVRADARIKISRDCTRLETYNLTLNLIKRDDAGDYEVKATNTLGSASTLSHVKVLSK